MSLARDHKLDLIPLFINAALARELRLAGANYIILAPFFPGDIPPGWKARNLTFQEQSVLAKTIHILEFKSPLADPYPWANQDGGAHTQ